MPLALSPELDGRLRAAFPFGSDESHLLRELRQQGFGDVSRCETDASVRFARYAQRGGSLLSHSIWAEVAWKVDDGSRIVWTKGFVAYRGL